ncbi:MAG TPA: glycosyltransferase family 39 protein [Acidimicrobiales bacterium]|nr:glycosyltransferase family 39 protein [Acidimicrobiales bacterium]
MPLVLLGLLSLLSLGARLAWITTPDQPMFDERYYVNAARTILHLPVPPTEHYAGATPGIDPNREHPPLAKLAIAAGIRAFGDGPFGWRAASLAFGSAAILALYWLVRSARGSPWVALGAASLMAVENLFFVHSRMGTLDIFVVVFMLVGVALYLRERPALAGAVIGVAACTKLTGALALVVVVIHELLRYRRSEETPEGVVAEPADPHPRMRLRTVATCAAAAAVAYLGLLSVLDARFTTFPDPVAHTQFMLGYSSNLPERPTARTGFANAPTSQPWQWLVNQVPIRYYAGPTEAEKPASSGPHEDAGVLFVGRMNPFVIFFALPALALAARDVLRRRDGVATLVVAWTAGTFLPLLVINADRKLSYIFYMLVVLPGILVGIARFFPACRLPRAAVVGYALAVAYGFWTLYPFRAWIGG